MQTTFNNLTEWSAGTNGLNEDIQTRQAQMLVETLQSLAGGPHGYRLRRILLTNFWLYGQQEFEIPHGRLFLAGENASGKSTVLMAALPLALDGDLRPNRLDTFGGRERHIEYYVLGGTESATPYSHERRTAYIALEFEWCDPDSPPIAPELRQRWENGEREKTRFLTIGLSIAGNANVTDRIRPLRFLITDGSRLGYDLDTTYETGNKHERRAFDHIRFKQMLEGHGIICDSQAEYERQVARHLFGFSDEKDFQKLINLLLVLRRPNLSSELSFSRVHDYLKQSLRKISGETTHRVIGTIERIDAISSEIERIQEAYNATERLHQVRQHLALVRAQLAAGEYLGAQLAEDAISSRVAKLRKDLSTAEKERSKAEARSQALQTEHYQINGQIQALEASEGLQVAQQLASVRERVQEAEAQMHLQEQSREAARHATRENAESLERQLQRFEKMKTESAAHLQELYQIATGESYWEVVALQLQEALREVNSLSPETISAPQIPPIVTSLVGVDSEERIAWLHRLEELHQQREQLETKVQYARTLETTRFAELDNIRHRFQSIQDRGYEAQQSLAKTLEQFIASIGLADRALETETDTSTVIDTNLVGASAEQSGARFNPSRPSPMYRPPEPSIDTQDEESLTSNAVEQFATALNDYRQTIDMLESELIDAVDQVQGEMDELQLLTGSKNHEIAELNALYEQKLSEPEYTPEHPARRTQARAKLAEHGIAALPLYALLDFTSGIDSAEAGRIEYILEDAGILDALVVAPSQVAAADALLAAEGLSDCRMDIAQLTPAVLGAATVQNVHSLLHWLRFDAAVKDNPDASGIDWEPTTTAILAALSKSTDTNEMTQVNTRFVINEDGSWTHGLLTGRAGGGSARVIGKATRLSIRRRELEELAEKRARLDEELKWLIHQLEQYEQQLVQLQDKQVQLRKLLANSGLEEIYIELSQVRTILDDARGKYQKARLQTQEARESRNALVAQLERESKGIAALTGDLKQVQKALMGTMKLKNQAMSLHTQLVSISHTWEEYQKSKDALQKAKTNEANVAHLYERVRNQALQARAQLEELQRVAEFSNAEELSERLHTLRERSEALFTELDEAKASYARADERANNTTYNLSEAEAHLLQVQQDRVEKQAHFVDLLTAYPVEALLAAHQLTASEQHSKAAQKLLEEPVSEADIPARKEHLEGEYRESYNNLSRTFNREQSILLEYGPDLDDQGNVLFLNENKSRPVELLELLSERIEMQKMLLGQEERQLFEDFLLQEMAEAIRTHILESEEWVQQINNVLSGLPMIGEHYALQWKQPVEFDMAKLGSHLAQHYRLLRKPAQTLTTEETETLMNAFRREIEAVRIQQQENPAMNFMEALEQVFDYREWFHFDVLVTPVGGQRQRLTDRIAGTRSGAEQLFALYVPLFAALGALYRSAAPGAPRLLALDEAFDKVSVANTQRIMEFLVSQDFQWIMTGPQISGTGAKIPACARYLMIHEKGSPIATASATFWSDSFDIQSINDTHHHPTS